MKKIFLILGLLLIILALTGAIFGVYKLGQLLNISIFQRCQRCQSPRDTFCKGNTSCVVPQGSSYGVCVPVPKTSQEYTISQINQMCGTSFSETQPIDKPSSEENCVNADTKVTMSFTQAKEIALKSECIKNGGLKEAHFCNESSGTWWIDLEIQKEGCAPACVIDVTSQQAEINWRCTGAKFVTPSENQKVLCWEPRPEVCTMECVAQPPYICGSDGKSYCSKCQVCANPAVGWYTVQDTPCVNR